MSGLVDDAKDAGDKMKAETYSGLTDYYKPQLKMDERT